MNKNCLNRIFSRINEFIIGWPADIYQKIMGHCTTKMMIKEAGDHLVFDFKSDAMPKDASQGETVFKFGEEFEWKNPFDPTDKLTVIVE